MKTNYEIFCDELNNVHIPLSDKLRLQNAAYLLNKNEYTRGFKDASDIAQKMLFI